MLAGDDSPVLSRVPCLPIGLLTLCFLLPE